MIKSLLSPPLRTFKLINDLVKMVAGPQGAEKVYWLENKEEKM